MLRDQSPATESFASYSYRMDQMDLEGGTNGGAVSKSDVDSKRILAEEGLKSKIYEEWLARKT
ncbi:hypothetical protein L914_08637 [Phytophthora nicotianae]|uniref:Uncharacterized protein n=1 Tax=Phytophthora nicotianae TaxID=4792 RepID=W2NEX7_PHYNI|nr:hypothetical protein L914_08637 [Phytophthora nicotianae]